MTETTESAKRLSLKELAGQKPLARHLPKLLSLGMGLILIGWLIAQLNISEALQILQEVSISYIILGLVLYGMSFYFRTRRFRILLPEGAGYHALFPIVLVHYTALNIIPARLGEFSYVYLLKKIHDVPAGLSVSTLLLARVFDQIAISVLFLCSLTYVELTTPWLKTVSWIVGAALVASVALLLLLLLSKNRCLLWGKKLLRVLKWEHHNLAQRGVKLFEDVVSGLDTIESKKTAGMVLVLSFLIWLSILGVNYMVLKAFQVELSYVEVVLASTFLILLTVIPFQVFSGLGLRSLTWTVIAGAMGVAKDTAIVSALGSRVVMTIYLAVIGVYGLWKISATLHREGDEI